MLVAIILTGLQVAGQSQSVLSSGNWYKLAVGKPGVYRIDHALLRQLGIDPAQINPAHIRIFGNEGGMLPQANDAARPASLTESAIFVSGEGDGKFDAGDYILFYADGPDRLSFDTTTQSYTYEKNLYSDHNFYFLNVDSGPGKRLGVSPDAGRGYPAITTFDYVHHHENDTYNELHSGRDWFGEKFGVNTLTHTFDIALPGIVAESTITLASDILGQSHAPAELKVAVNNQVIGTHHILPIANSRYGQRGLDDRQTFQIAASAVNAHIQNSLSVRYEFSRGTSSFSQAYLDWFTLTTERTLRLYDNLTIFSSTASLENPITEFRVAGTSAGVTIWDVTNPANVMRQDFTENTGVAAFSTETSVLRRFVVFNLDLPRPEVVGKIPNQDLESLSGVDLVIVTHPDFQGEAQRLADHRRSHSGWSVAVVTVDQIYNEYASGRQDVSAIRDFVRGVYQRSGALQSVLLFGRASYDYKDRVGANTNFVPTYQSRNSMDPLRSYSSDDYFALLEDEEGEWAETSGTTHTLDIGVGRLPVVDADEARIVVDKIIAYETHSDRFGYWRKQIAFVADDGNNADGYTSTHQSQANQLANFLEGPGRHVDTRKMFMGAYPKVVRPNSETVPALTADVLRTFDRGALIINYTGHGSERQLGDENFFNHTHIRTLENTRLPFLVTATCEFGRHDDPQRISSAEMSMLKEDGGSIGLVTTARLVNAETNFNLNFAFYEALFQRHGDYFHPLGEVFRQTKNNSTSGVANRNFSLLGDPSMTLALPPHVVAVTELATESGSDTLKALSTVVVKGEVRTAGGNRMNNFNGILTATLFDKENNYQTIGRNNPPFQYSEWNNALYRGQVSVRNGGFEFRFTMPKNIDYTLGFGKLSLYAHDTATFEEAAGTTNSFKVGFTETDVVTEETAPKIRLYMGDTTFVNGGVVTPDSWLIARLTDDTGINISDYGIGNSLIAVLDEDVETFPLGEYFVADLDDPTSGWVRFPVRGLSPGRHTFTVKVWDVFNNASAGKVNFIVTDGKELVIERFGNYPNPFSASTTLFFTHNRSGDHLQAEVHILDITGTVVQQYFSDLPNSGYYTVLAELSGEDFSKKAAPGIYVARLIVRSLTNGSKSEQVTKLFVSN